MDLSAGDKLGPYEILSPIGAGGMGDVWKARDTRLDRVAELMEALGAGQANATSAAFAIFHLLCGEIKQAAEWTERAGARAKASDGCHVAADASLEAPVELCRQMAKAGKDNEFAKGGGMLNPAQTNSVEMEDSMPESSCR
jgi:serine/threonine protein kinase